MKVDNNWRPKMINVEPTAKIIESMARILSEYSKEMESIAEKMRSKNDISYASEAIQSVTNMVNNLRLDLLITRPLREFQNLKPMVEYIVDKSKD